MTRGALPFDGLKVIDAAMWIAAPVAATILGDLGADVVKVEPPGDGDPYRQLPDLPTFPSLGVNYTYAMDGRNKRSLSLNLKSDEGRAVLKRLIEHCDVYITNQPLPMREAYGLTYEALAPLNPRMIFASLTAYGERGPERNRGSFDQVAYWARSGLGDLVRAPGAPPTQSPPGMGDHPTGVTLFAAIVTALYRRQQTGRGGLVHTSLLANGYFANGCLGQAALAGADFSDRRQPGADDDQPKGFAQVLYETNDGRYLLFNMVRSPQQIQAFFRAMGLEKLLEEERFATPETRFENGGELAERFREVVAQRSCAEWLTYLHACGVPVGHVAQVEEIKNDEQAIANQVLVAPTDADVGMDYVINHPVRLDDIDAVGPIRPPEVGEHSEEILDDLGYEQAEIERLRRAGVI